MIKRSIGNGGEELACKYLTEHGATILARNYQTSQGEVDIIALHNDVLLFIEVKLRSTGVYGSATEAVTLKKQKKICLAALGYLTKNQIGDRPMRFDVIAIDGGKIRHLENAFEFIS